MSLYLKFLFVVGLAVGLSACGSAARKTQPEVLSETQSVSQSVTSTEEFSGSVSSSKETATTKQQEKLKDVDQTQEELASLDYEIAPLQPEIDDDPEKLLGINSKQLMAKLGEPSLIRRENPAEIWQYSTNSCVLDLVFYDSMTAYVESRDDQVRPMDSRICLRKLLLSRKNW
ncbi:hypothetical protein [Kiloniella sp.]|uniref:hypothetical protein n=1 Tax=Kiloniella sp. TaxID=1938587 RepID=UPI003B018B54